MASYQQSFRMTTKGNTDVRDITTHVEEVVRRSGIRNGIVNVSGKGSTLGITTIEFEPGAVSDLRRALDSIAPVSDECITPNGARSGRAWSEISTARRARRGWVRVLGDLRPRQPVIRSARSPSATPQRAVASYRAPHARGCGNARHTRSLPSDWKDK